MSFEHELQLVIFYGSLSDSKPPQLCKTLLSILVDSIVIYSELYKFFFWSSIRPVYFPCFSGLFQRLQLWLVLNLLLLISFFIIIYVVVVIVVVVGFRNLQHLPWHSRWALKPLLSRADFIIPRFSTSSKLYFCDVGVFSWTQSCFLIDAIL